MELNVPDSFTSDDFGADKNCCCGLIGGEHLSSRSLGIFYLLSDFVVADYFIPNDSGFDWNSCVVYVTVKIFVRVPFRLAALKKHLLVAD